MQDFLNFAADVLEVDPSTLSGETAYESIPQWDSLAHMRLVMEIEEEYGIEVPIEEMPNRKTLASLYELVKG